MPASFDILARMERISKRFGPVTVLSDVTFEIRAREVHVLAGENGAGKSTLIKILAGIHTDFDGTMELHREPYAPHDPLDARRRGVAVIHQELSLVPFMSVADNVFLGRPAANRAGFIDDREQRTGAREALLRLGLDLDVDKPVADYPIATQQLIEIAKALSQDARVIVMDEPTSALNAPEVERLFELIEHLNDQGCGIVYISHRMEEIERIADRITVLRDGEHIGTAPAADLTPDELIEWMVGRRVKQQFPRHTPHLGEESLRLERFSVFPRGFASAPAVRDVCLTARTGEILGIAGLQGSGASELFGGIFGAYGQRTRGSVFLNGKPVSIGSCLQAIRRGVGMLTSDRKGTGLVPSGSVIANTVLADLPRFSPGGWCRPAMEREAAREATAPLRLRAASLDMPVGSLSGGNQQKVVLAKWLQTRPRLVLLDEPTRGIDVGAKREIYALMNEWTAQGIAILLITSEMPELLAMSDRILVLHRGECTAQFEAGEATAAKVLEAAMGKRQEKISA